MRPPSALRFAVRSWFLILRSTLPLILALILLAIGAHETVSPWVLVNIALFPAITLASLALHEAGHALVGHAVGLVSVRVELGLGRRVSHWRWRRTHLALNALPLVGFTVLGSDHTRGLRWRLWVAVAGGPVVTAGVIAVAVALAPTATLGETLAPASATVGRFAGPELLAFANIWMLVFSILPLRAGSDGMQLLTLPFRAREALAEVAVNEGVFAALDLREQQRDQEAQRTAEATLARMPQSCVVRNFLAVNALDRGELAEARAGFLSLLEGPVPSRPMRTVLYNNLAWADFRLRRDDLMAEADRYSLDAYDRAPSAAATLGTRGAVLGWLGRHGEARALLERSHRRTTTPRDRAMIGCLLAVSFAALGESSLAARWLAIARADDGACVFIREAEDAIGHGRTAPESRPDDDDRFEA